MMYVLFFCAVQAIGGNETASASLRHTQQSKRNFIRSSRKTAAKLHCMTGVVHHEASSTYLYLLRRAGSAITILTSQVLAPYLPVSVVRKFVCERNCSLMLQMHQRLSAEQAAQCLLWGFSFFLFCTNLMRDKCTSTLDCLGKKTKKLVELLDWKWTAE